MPREFRGHGLSRVLRTPSHSPSGSAFSLTASRWASGWGEFFPRAEITRGVFTAGIAARSLKSPPSSAISWRNESSVKEIGLTSDELAGLPALGVLTLEAEPDALDAELLGIPCGGITGLGESI